MTRNTAALRRFATIALFSLAAVVGMASAAPVVSLTAPVDGGAWNAPVNLAIKASATADSGTTLTRIDFYADGTLIGSDSSSGYSITWNAIPVGPHVLTAVALQNDGQSSTSAARTITVTDTASNIPPTVNVTAPANNSSYALPVDVTVSATAADIEKNGGISLVEFLADGQVIGSVTAKPYSIVWHNPTVGSHLMAARATDVLGAQTTSAAVRTVTIDPSATPPNVSLGGVTPGTYLPPVSYNLTAGATSDDVNTPVTLVEFLANGAVIGSTTTKPYAFTWSNPAPGSYDITARATNSAGLTATTAAKTVTIAAANTAPTVNLTAPANNSTYVLPATLVVSANATDLEKNGGVTQVDFLANGQIIGTSTSKPYSIAWSPGPGSYTLIARATDNSGAQTDSAARTVTLSDNNAPPKVSLTAPANNANFTVPANVTLSASASGPEANTPIALVEFLADGNVIGTTTATPYSTLWNNAPLGSHVLAVRATDSLGAVTLSKTRSITVSAANTPPTVALTSPANNSVVPAPGSVTLTANAADSDGTIAKVEFFNGATLIGTATTAPYSFTWNNVPSGSYTLTAKATDDKGAITSSAPITLSVDTPPTVALTSPANGASYVAPGTLVITANATDSDGSIAQVEFYNGATLIGTATTAPYTATLNNAAVGSYTLTAKATDNLGIATNSGAITVTVNPNQPPTVTLTAPANNSVVPAPANVTLTANAADSDGSIAKVEFYQGTILIATATSAPYTVAWNNVPSGTYVLTPVATDDKGASTTGSAVKLTVNNLPTVTLTAPANNAAISAPGNVTLTATAADSDGTIAKVDFYQGTTLIGTTTTAPYTFTWTNVPAGTYSLSAHATDNLDGSTTSAPVTVILDAPPTISLTSPTANQVIAAPGPVSLSVTTASSGSTIAQVDYYNGATLIGTATTAPFSFSWNNVVPGSYTLTATATDALGIAATSTPVTITVNALPTVSLTSPASGAAFVGPLDIPLSATAADSDGTIAQVEFYQGTTLIGTATTAPYSVTWHSVAAGSYSLTAKATDNQGGTTTSSPVSITVVANQAPSVSLTSPTPNQSFTAPATIALTANATDPDNNLAKVEFYANAGQGATLVGTALSTPYSVTWSNVAQGNYSLTVVATDSLGSATTSAPVSITVTPGHASVFYLFPDHLDIVRLVTDSANNIVWKNAPTSEPFGNTPPEADPNNTGTPFQFNLGPSGYYRDSETQTLYAYFRDIYRTDTGTFGQSDPIGLEGGSWSTYTYVGGNPLSRIDPLGLLDRVIYESGRLRGYDDFAVEFDVPAVSGPHGKGRLPNGNYNGNTLRKREDNKAMMCKGSGWSLNLDPTFNTDRTDLRIHPDGNVVGTEGCIGPSCGADQQKVYDSLRDYFKQPGNTSIPVTVR